MERRTRPSMSFFGLELLFIDLVLGDFVGDAPARQAGDIGALADVAARLAQCAGDVPFLECRNEFGQLLRQLACEIDLERVFLAFRPTSDVRREVLDANHPVAGR